MAGSRRTTNLNSGGNGNLRPGVRDNWSGGNGSGGGGGNNNNGGSDGPPSFDRGYLTHEFNEESGVRFEAQEKNWNKNSYWGFKSEYPDNGNGHIIKDGKADYSTHAHNRTMPTDRGIPPKVADYVVEHGRKRDYVEEGEVRTSHTSGTVSVKTPKGDWNRRISIVNKGGKK